MEIVYRLLWTRSAERDLINIVEYIKTDSPANTRSVFENIRIHVESTNFFPFKGRIVPELAHEGITLYREIIVEPWRILYKISEETVYIMAIIDSRQNVEDILFRRLLR